MNFGEYKPAPINVEDIVDAEVALAFPQDITDPDGERIANLAEELTTSVETTLKSGQVLYFPEGLCANKIFDPNEFKRFVRNRIEERLEAAQLKNAETQGFIFEAKVERLYPRFNSLCIHIDDPRYTSGRTVYIEDLEAVQAILGENTKPGTRIKVKDIKFKPAIKTPNGNGPKITWHNQRVAAFHSAA